MVTKKKVTFCDYNDHLVGGTFNEECASLGFLSHSMALKDYIFKNIEVTFFKF